MIDLLELFFKKVISIHRYGYLSNEIERDNDWIFDVVERIFLY